MDDEIEIARNQIIQMKTELKYERKARKKAESVNRRLARELAEERKGRETIERICEELARQASHSKSETDRLKKDMEEERKMMRMAQVLREERVQMKLAEARVLLEERLSQFDGSKGMDHEDNQKHKAPKFGFSSSKAASDLSGKFSGLVLGEKCFNNESGDVTDSKEYSTSNENDGSTVSSMTNQKRASPDSENPHIKRGIKGFVEFPRMVRGLGSRNRSWGSKLECQQAQLRILLKHKSRIKSNTLILS